MSEKLKKSYLDWFSSLSLERPLQSLEDLSDPSYLFDILSAVDPNFFRNPRSTEPKPNENWVLRFNAHKRLYKLIMRYYEDILHNPPTVIALLPVPDLAVISKATPNSPAAAPQICILLSLVLTLCVQAEASREMHVLKIQQLEEWQQGILMREIEGVMTKLSKGGGGGGGGRDERDEQEMTIAADDEYYVLQTDRNRLHGEMEKMQKVNDDTLKQFNILKEDHEEAIRNLQSVERQLEQARRDLDIAQANERGDAGLRHELDRLRSDLHARENEIGHSESVISKQTKTIEDLTRKVEDLTHKAEEGVRLKDQLDEYKHAADKVQKMENVMEKYKKKLEESADLRRTMKALEDQNLELLDKNSSLEDEYRKVANYKPIMDQYKSQIASLEEKNAKLTRENDDLRYSLERTEERLRIAEEEREKEGEAVQLFEERVKELESETVPKRRRPRGIEDVDVDGGVRDSVLYIEGVGAELDDAIQGTTMTDLKLKIRKLEKDLTEAKRNKADTSRIVVLENLLEDSNRMKSRYETDWLKEHRERLILQEKLDLISQGKSSSGDGAEATIALRQRLNETVEELEKVRKELTEMTVKFEYVDRDLTIAKSNLNLVNKDQLDILSTLRDQVSVEKVALQKELDKLREEFKTIDDQNKMQMSQINKLLMEKVDLQSKGIGQREKMMERERELGNIKASYAGKGMNPVDQKRFAELELELKEHRETIKKQEKTLAQAKEFIRQQEKLWKKQGKSSDKAPFDQAEEVYQNQITQLKEQVQRLQEQNESIEKNYKQEVRLVTSAWHRLAIQSMRESITNGTSARATGKSWLSQQRERSNGRLRG